MIKYKNILILAGNGMMGNTILKYLNSKSELNIFYSIRNSKKKLYLPNFLILNDLYKKENFKKLKNFIKKKDIKLIINCSGITKHETEKNQKKFSLKINTLLNNKLAKIKKVKLLILSTDCVFNGIKGNYNELSKDFNNDLYGKTKRMGEKTNLKNAITFRSSGVGHEIDTKKGLLEWFLKNKSKKINGYVNAFFTGPTTLEIAKIIYKYVLTNKIKHGLYHIGANKISKFDLLQIIKVIYKKKIIIIKNNKLKIDRSLDTTKFRKKTNFVSQNWLNLIKETKKFNEKFS
jgi:dTDP-4-dehydrorhamnose reductase